MQKPLKNIYSTDPYIKRIHYLKIIKTSIASLKFPTNHHIRLDKKEL